MEEMTNKLYIYGLGEIELSTKDLGTVTKDKFDEEYDNLIKKWERWLIDKKGKILCWHKWWALSEDDIKSLPENRIRCNIEINGKIIYVNKELLGFFTDNVKKCRKCSKVLFDWTDPL